MKITRLALAACLILTSALPASAGWPFRRHEARGVRFLRGIEYTTVVRQKLVVRSTVATSAPACPTPAGYPVAPLPSPQSPALVPQGVPGGAVYLETPKPVAMAPEAVDGPGTLVFLVNDARARIGRPSLVWDAALASAAATNTGYDAFGRLTRHSPWSIVGGQCWAGTTSYRHAFNMWSGSPDHWTILMNATTSIGGTYSAAGITVNAR